jgi:alkanesulfonate monooxygenase SsuD/methylene tetrahydromethanopterin reductase-like flavin-dependent oxidoreductase (luciferase family)
MAAFVAQKGSGVKFGLSYNTGIYGADPGKMTALAKHAEDRGFESFYVSEHIVLYPGARQFPRPWPSPTRSNA